MTEATPPVFCPKGGTMLPALRHTNSSPGPHWVIVSGMTRLSAQEIMRALGFCPSWISLR